MHSFSMNSTEDVFCRNSSLMVKQWSLTPVTDLDLQLFVQCIVNPQVDVSSPVSLLLDRGNVGNGSLVNFSHRVRLSITLHQPKIIEPCVVVVWVGLRTRVRKCYIKVCYS